MSVLARAYILGRLSLVLLITVVTVSFSFRDTTILTRLPPFGSLNMESIVSRFLNLKPVIEEILAVSGVVSLSYGVIHEGKLTHIKSFS